MIVKSTFFGKNSVNKKVLTINGELKELHRFEFGGTIKGDWRTKCDPTPSAALLEE